MRLSKIYVFVILLISLFVFGCGKQSIENSQTNLSVEQNKNIPSNKSVSVMQTNSHVIKSENLESVSKNYLGCYSAGDRSRTMIYISPKFIQTTNGKQKIPYVLISAEDNAKRYLLKLLEKDKSNYLEGFESITFVSDDEILLEDYESEETFKNGKRVGFLGGLIRDKCKTILSFMK